MRGISSQAMVLVAHSHDDPGQVEIVRPPTEAQPGDKVCFFQDQQDIRAPLEPVMNPKKKIFETVQPHLSIRSGDGVVMFQSLHPLHVPGKGFLSVPSIRKGTIS